MRLIGFASLHRVRRRLLSRVPEPVRSAGGRIWRDERGATAIEFALVAGILVFLLLNGIDLARYIYVHGQVETATQAGAHAIWERCDPMKLPIVTKCYTDQAAAKTAVVNVISSIVKGVTNNDVTVTEGYYCPDAAGALHTVTNVASPPAQCLSGVVPGDYVEVRVTYSFVPLFRDLTVASMFGASISTTSYMRLQ